MDIGNETYFTGLYKMPITDTCTFVSSFGADENKMFLISKMPAFKQEKFAYRALMALARSGVEIPEGMTSNTEKLAAIGLTALLKADFNDIEPLLDEMLQYVKIIPNQANPKIQRDLREEDIEDVRTIMALRKEIFAHNVDFLMAASSRK